MKFRFPDRHHRRGLPLREHVGLGIRALAARSRRREWRCSGVTSYGDLSQFAQQQSRASGFILSIDDEEFTPGPELDPALLKLRTFIQEIRFPQRRDPDLPLRRDAHVAPHSERHPARAARLHPHVRGHAGVRRAHIIREVQGRISTRWRHRSSRRSSITRRTARTRGTAPVTPARRVPEESRRPDVPSVLRREHAARRRLQFGRRARAAPRPLGPGGGGERNAARIFNADHCFFVTNGTSTSNKMVWHATVAPDDIVVVDRNCHVSILHAITMTGRDSRFPDADAQPPRASSDRFRSTSSAGEHQKTIEANPFAREAKNKKPRILTLTQSTYDGVAYNVEMLKQTLERLHRHAALRRGVAAARGVPRVLQGHARDRQGPPAQQGRLIFATHSTHKLLAGISQASQIIVQESGDRKLDRTSSTRRT
jgi:hypothetical protein